jgi:hypothetical protein
MSMICSCTYRIVLIFCTAQYIADKKSSQQPFPIKKGKGNNTYPITLIIPYAFKLLSKLHLADG